jgi:hypothetical protein
MRQLSGSIVFLLNALLLCAPALPPEHSHPANQDHAGVVHRHWSMHLARHSAHPSIDEDDGRILWIDAGFVSSDRAVHARLIPVIAPDVVLPAGLVVRGWVSVETNPQRVHGPPLYRRNPRSPPDSRLV